MVLARAATDRLCILPASPRLELMAMDPVARTARVSAGRSVALVHSQPGHASHCYALADDNLQLYAITEGHGRGLAAEAIAAATLRACVRARLTLRERATDEATMKALVDAVAGEIHQLRNMQRAYETMASSLAVVLLDRRRAVLGIAGDCVAFLDRGGELRPHACGHAVLLGPTPRVSATLASVEELGRGDKILLAVGGVLEFSGRRPGRARRMNPHALLEAGRECAPTRGAGLVTLSF